MTYVDTAEEVIKKLMTNKNKRGEIEIFSTSQIRNLLAMTAEIYNEVSILEEEELSEDMAQRIDYLRVRYMYAAGKDTTGTVKLLLDKAQILDLLKKARKSRNKFTIFYHYMESLVAFRKYYVKNDREL